MSEWKVYKGQFHLSNAGLTTVEATEAEALISRRKVADFIFEGDLLFTTSEVTADAGLVFRANPDSVGSQGGFYYASISPGGRVLLSRMPSSVELGSAMIKIQPGVPIHIKVQAVNETLAVYVGDMRTPKIEQKDSTFRSGFNGVRVHQTSATFANITIIPVVRQNGIVDNCTKFYRAVAGDTCQAITSKQDSAVSVSQL